MNEKILKIFKKYAGDNRELNRDDNLISDFGLDSLEYIDLIADVEDEFGIQINAIEMLKVRTVGNLLDYIVPKIDSTATASDNLQLV